MVRCCASPRDDARGATKIFSIFVDRIFTTSIKAPFTNAFDVIPAIAAIACVCRAGHAD
jgi:acetyl-CoA carboxylase carboxyltransferase component